MVTSGAIARGMGVMELPMRPRAVDELQAASAVGQGKLYQVYDELLRARGVPTAQVLLTFFDMSARTHYLNARQTLRKLLEWRVVPVINENDTTTTDEISFGNNDFLAAQVAILLGAERLLLLTDAGGVFTADPHRDPSAELVTEVTDFSALEPLDIGQTASALGSGGMRSKVVAAEMATAAGIPTVIASGLAPAPSPPPPPARRPAPVSGAGGPLLELQAVAEVRQAGARPGAGRCRRRTGAARAAAPACCRWASSRSRACSRPGTRWRSPTTTRPWARGSATTRRSSCARCVGCSRAAVREVLPRASEEAIHRDYFVLA